LSGGIFFKVENLFINFDNFTLKNINFTIDQSDYLSIIGPTGSGKTLILETIIGFYNPDKGKIFLEGKDITNYPVERRSIGIIYQDYSLFPHLNVYKNIGYGLKDKSKDKINDIAKLFNIENLLDRFPSTLSGGEQQRVAMARALVVEPKLLLMDEPFSALDNQTRAIVRRRIKDLVKRFNITVVHITHDLDDVWGLSNKVAFIKDGKLQQFGSTNEIMHKPETKFVADFVGTNIIEGVAIETTNGLTNVDIGGSILSIYDIAEKGDKIHISIRPENIIISKDKPPQLSARNIIKSELVDYFYEGQLCYLFFKLNNNNSLKALITINGFEDLNIDIGSFAFLIMKATNIKIIK